MSVVSNLFRAESLQYASQKFYGDTTRVQPIGLTYLTVLIVGIVLVAGIFLWAGEYARKQTVTGYLNPDAGLVVVRSKSSGAIVRKMMVENGQDVVAGQPLAIVSYSELLPGGKDASQEILNSLKKQRNTLRQRLLSYRVAKEREHVRLEQQLAETVENIELQKSLERKQQQRVGVLSDLRRSKEKLARSGAIAKSELLRSKAEHLDQERSLIEARQSVLQLQSSQNTIRYQLAQLPDRTANGIAEIETSLSDISNRITESINRQDELIVAPVDGRVVSLQYELGQSIAVNKPLVSIEPVGSDIEGVLLLPSSAIGFVEVGQTIRVRFDAFPHQQFGTHPAEISSISEAPITGNDLLSPMQVQGSVYVAKAKLRAKTMSVLGTERSLRSGMAFQADIILESRSLAQWLLEPFYNLRGRTS
ncbi:MAG: HlyD family secretion protein [Pseudomonadales bacterium]